MSFKTCTNCGKQWGRRDAYLADSDVVLIGYQANFADLDAGIFLFQHMVPECETTLAVELAEFTDMHDGPVFEVRKEDTADCPGYCKVKSNLEPCDQKCECAYVRKIIQKVRHWPKKAA